VPQIQEESTHAYRAAPFVTVGKKSLNPHSALVTQVPSSNLSHVDDTSEDTVTVVRQSQLKDTLSRDWL